MPHPDDRDLVARVLAADEAAFQLFYERYFGRVLAHATRRLGASEAARTATEATFVELLEALGGYRGDVPLDVVVFQIVRRRIASALAPRPRAAPRPARAETAVPRPTPVVL